MTANEAAAAAGRKQIETAEEDHRQTAAFLAALEERVRAGDPDIKPAELRDAQDLVGYAALRVDAAKRNAEQLETGARHALYATLGAEARTLDLTEDPAILDAFTEAVAALRRVATRAGQRSTKIRDLARRAIATVDLADQHGEREQLRAAGLHNAGHDGAGQAVVTVIDQDGAGRFLTDVQAHHIVAAALASAGLPDTAASDTVNPAASLTIAARVLPALATTDTPDAAGHQS
ncbi:hypothetical protein ACQEVZ_38670 [Dactylosporangium sp. CA-152071]|uniref:hypothetical protein n=1 Tax=Dactylosporangium sp. CA-152071 TaxID=3239933 RepID=UPI003D8B7F98